MASIYDLMPQSYDAMSGQWSPAGSTGEEISPQSQSGYDHIVAALHGLVHASDPFGGASDPSVRPFPAAVGGLSTALNGIPPVAGVHLVGNLLSSLAPTATAEEQGLPKEAQGGGFVPLNGEPRPSFSQDENTQIDKLRGQLTDAQGRLQKAIGGVEAKRMTVIDPQTGAKTIKHQKDPQEVESATSGIKAEMQGYQKSLDAVQAGKLAQQQDWDKRAGVEAAARHEAMRPYWERASQQEKDFVAKMPQVSYGVGAALGLTGAPKYVTSGLMGAGEGLAGALYPSYMDLTTLPEGSAAKEAAWQRLKDLKFWGGTVAPEAGAGALLSLLGTYHGGAARSAVGGTVNTLRNMFGSKAASSEAEAAAPAAAAITAPKPVSTDAAGRAVHVGQNGRTMFQDKLGRWQHVGGGMVKKEHSPLWDQLTNP